jgi:UDPglucose 6-dehydrogenase
MAEELDLGYDLFDSVMLSREVQAENMAKRLMELAGGGEYHDVTINAKPIIIVGKAYKPLVPYDAGSPSMLVGHYIEENGYELHYLDEVMGEIPSQHILDKPAVYLIAHNPEITYGEQLDFVKGWYDEHRVTGADEALTVATANGTELQFAEGSTVVDPWRKLPPIKGVKVVHYGNTRKEALR